MSSVDCLLSPEAERQPTCGKDYQTSLSKTILYVTLRLLKVVCLFNQTIGDILRQRPINIHLSIAISLTFLFLPCNMPYMFYMCPVKLDNDLPATVDASFFRLLKLSAPSWFKIPGNISAISEKIYQ